MAEHDRDEKQDDQKPREQRLPFDVADADEGGGLAAYVSFLEGIPADNAIARRFISAAHMLARAVLVNTIFTFVRGLEFTWEESAEMTGDILNMSRSSVARQISDLERLITFWNAQGYPISSIEEVVEQVSALTKKRLAEALEEKAEEEIKEGRDGA